MRKANHPRPKLHPQTAEVWDIWVRLFHWSLVSAIAIAALTGFFANATWLRLHVIAGLSGGALVLARILWGFAGTTHARFADFVPSPGAVRAHLKGQGRRHLGHNPLGALMVLALIGMVMALVLSGLGVLGGVLRTGPFAADLTPATGFALREAHEIFALALLGLIALHLGGVIFESRRSQENLARAMVTGQKPRRKADAPARRVQARGGLALLGIAALGGGLGLANAGLASRPVSGLPTATILPVVAEECGACHMVYHPTLLPAEGWRKVMATLDDHFGEDASLDDALTAQITDWLAANAAQTVETKPARLFARATPEPTLGITDRPVWKRIHRDLPEARFTAAPVYSRANCAACHGDAALGRFSPFAIKVPRETQP